MAHVGTWDEAIEVIETIKTLRVEGPLSVLLECSPPHRVAILRQVATTLRGVDGQLPPYTAHTSPSFMRWSRSASYREHQGYTMPGDLAWPQGYRERNRLADLADAAADRLRGAK